MKKLRNIFAHDYKRVLQSGVLLVAAILSQTLQAQPSRDENFRDPRMKEGQMLSVRLVPAGKQIKVYLVGKEMIDIRKTDVGLQAFVRVSKDEMKAVGVQKGTDHFLITNPEDMSSELKLKIDYKGSSEDFKFNLDTIK